MRICLFCNKKLVQTPSVSSDFPFSTHICRDCRPPYKTFFKEVYDNAQRRSVSDHFNIGDIYVSRYFYLGRTTIEKIYGMLDTTQISIEPPICNINSIAVFNFSDIEKLKNKINTYILVS